MNNRKNKKKKRNQIYGTMYKHRLSIFRSNKEISAQLIDDINGKTLVLETTLGKKIQGTKIEKAIFIGKQIGKKSLILGIKKVIFDRNHYIYHGRIKALAEAARASGLLF